MSAIDDAHVIGSIKSWRSTDVLSDNTKAQPPEILGSIFGYICGREVLLPPQDNGYPWILGHVCSRWRRILWKTTSIWTRITVVPGRRKRGYSNTFSSIHLDIIKGTLEYILFHTTTPICLTIFSRGVFEELEDIVFENLDRLSELSLNDIYYNSLLDLLHQSPPNIFAILEKLSISIRYRPEFRYIPEVDDTNTSFIIAPNLQSVTYKMPESTYIPSLFILPWTRIQEICVEGMPLSPSTIYDIWRSTPSLISYHLTVDEDQDIPPGPGIALQALKVLELDVRNIFDWNSFLKPLVTPSLESFAIISPQIPLQALTSLIVRSGCFVQRLNLFLWGRKKDELDGTDFGFLLDHLSSMVSLTVSCCIPPSVIRQIHNGALPNLRDAKFSMHPEGFGVLLDMIESYVTRTRSQDWPFDYLNLTCYEGPGFAEVQNRYLAREQSYGVIEGLKFSVFDGPTGPRIVVFLQRDNQGHNIDEDRWWEMEGYRVGSMEAKYLATLFDT